MPETFLILLAGGVMLAAAIPNPRDVTLQWLRLAGIIALTIAGLSAFFRIRNDYARSNFETIGYALVGACVCAQLAFTQVASRSLQRCFALCGFAVSLMLAT